MARWLLARSHFRLVMLAFLGLGSCGGAALGFEPVPSNEKFFNRSGVEIPIDSLRFTDSGWTRGRDDGYAVALQRHTTYFYQWIQGSGGKPLGDHPYCDGKLLDIKGAPVSVDAVTSFTVGNFGGAGSSFIVAVIGGGKQLVAWDLASCVGKSSLKAFAQSERGDSSGLAGPAVSDIIAGDFEGSGRDVAGTLVPETSEMLLWAIDDRSFRLVRRIALNVAPDSASRIHGIRYLGLTRLPHEKDNVAFESAMVILHDRGYTLVGRNGAIFFAPNCTEKPEQCAGKTLVFHLDQGFSDGLQDIAHKDQARAGEIIDREVASLRPLQRRYTVWALINPIHGDRQATLFVLDKLAAAGIPFILDFYSSDITNLASIKKNRLDYEPHAFEPLKGISLDIDAQASNPDGLDFYRERYREKFVGLRFMERLAIDINAKFPNGQPMVSDAALAGRELSFDWRLAERTVEWASRHDRIVIWSDPALYVPYECYWSPAMVQAAKGERDDFIERERQLAKRFPSLVPMYDDNEGLKRCGVAFGDWLTTPRNFRLTRWERIPSAIASGKSGVDPLTGRSGFGLSVQSWASDYDPIVSSGTLPAEEIAVWTLDAFAKGASIVEFEPYYFFFKWPADQGTPQSLPISDMHQVGNARPSLSILFSNLGVDNAQ